MILKTTLLVLILFQLIVVGKPIASPIDQEQDSEEKSLSKVWFKIIKSNHFCFSKTFFLVLFFDITSALFYFIGFLFIVEVTLCTE